MPYQPLTREQYQKAVDAGFSPDAIVQMEKKRKAQEDPAGAAAEQSRGGTSNSFSDLPVNILPSLGKVATSLTGAIAHPIDTVKALSEVPKSLGAKAGQLGIQAITGKKVENVDTKSFDSLAGFFKDRYGSLDNLKKTVINDPAGFALDLSSLLGGGEALAGKAGLTKTAEVLGKASELTNPVDLALKGGSKVVGTSANLAGKSVGKVLGQTTSRGSEVISSAFNKSPEFTQAMRSGSKEQLINDFKEGAKTLRDQRQSTYLSQFDEIQKGKGSFDISPVHGELKNQLDNFNVKVGKDGNLDFSRSAIANNGTARRDVQGVYETLKDWGSQPGDRTAKGLDTLKRQLGDFASDSGQARALVNSVLGKVKETLNTNVPGYEQMTSGYHKASNLINDINSSFSLGGKAAADVTFNKIISSLREDKELRGALVKQMEAKTGTNITDRIAGIALQDWLPPSLAGKLLSGGSIGSSVLLGPKAIIGLGLTLGSLSPRLVGETIHAIGVPLNKVKDVVTAIGELKKKVPGIGTMTSDELEKVLFQSGRLKDVNNPQQ